MFVFSIILKGNGMKGGTMMTDKQQQLEDLLSEISFNAKAIKIVFDDMLLNDMSDAGDRVYMGLSFCEKLIEASKAASETLVTN